jgi:hypothetical protein
MEVVYGLIGFACVAYILATGVLCIYLGAEPEVQLLNREDRYAIAWACGIFLNRSVKITRLPNDSRRGYQYKITGA